MVLVDGSSQQLTDASGNLLFEDGAALTFPWFDAVSTIREALPPILPVFSESPVGSIINLPPQAGTPLIDNLGEFLLDNSLNFLVVPDPGTVASSYDQSDVMPPITPYVVPLESFTPPPMMTKRRTLVQNDEPPKTAEYASPVRFELLSGDLGFKSLPPKTLGKILPNEEPPRTVEYVAQVRFEVLSGNTALAPAITGGGGGGTFYAVGVIVMLPKVSGAGGSS